MSKGLFVTATGTEVGKTYVTALLIRKLRQAGYEAGYYKAAVSGVEPGQESDPSYVRRIAQLQDKVEYMVSYSYREAVSPHLAARLEGRPVSWQQIQLDYERQSNRYDYLTVEGSGGIVCPLRCDEKEVLLLEEIPRRLHLGALIVTTAELGSINAAILTAHYLHSREIPVRGWIFNRYRPSRMSEDNVRMICELSGIAAIAFVPEGAEELDADAERLTSLYI